MASGAQSAMISGELQMPKWLAHSSATHEQVRNIVLIKALFILILFLCDFVYSGATAFSFAFFGQGSGPIHIDDVQCTGTETTLLGCRYLTIHNCVHAEDAGVRCQGCTRGDLRLVGGNTASEGRVEICRDSTWGTVCDDLWGTLDARVVCRQLGFSTFGPVARRRAFFGAGTGQILLDNVQCVGNETRLEDCTAITMHNCNHGEDAGVTCIAMRECHACMPVYLPYMYILLILISTANVE